MDDEMSWAGASWQRSFELTEQEYALWKPPVKEDEDAA